MIDIEQGALRAFEQNALARAPRAFREISQVASMKGRILGGDAVEFGADGGRRDGFEPEAPAQGLVVGKESCDFLIQSVGFGQVHETDRPPPNLILIGGPDAAFRGADLQGLDLGGFAVGIEFAVQAEDQRRHSRRSSDCPA